MPEDTFIVARDYEVAPAEIVEYQIQTGSAGWGVGSEEMWGECIAQSLSIVTARNQDRELVGLGFLIGNLRHAEPVDISVRPDVRNRGIGRRIMDELMRYAIERNIRYVNLIHDPAKPWLKDYYARMGFHPINFAMTHERSFNPTD